MSDQITKRMLKTIVDRQRMNGLSNNRQREAIISTLGGIDDILYNLLESNVNFSDSQLKSLYHIITHPFKQYQPAAINKTQKNIEDKGYKRNIKFTFNDDDILLYHIFRKKTATNIINILNSKIIKGVLVIMYLLTIPLAILSVSQYVLDIYLSSVFLMTTIYGFGWILYCNKAVMSMLFSEFEFWLKIAYLALYLITKAILDYVQGVSLFYNCVTFLGDGTGLFLVMIFDAINIKQTYKLLVSSFTLGLLA
eukprot:520643_1